MQVSTLAEAQAGPAEIYDSRFVPALFAQWGPVLCGAASVSPGDAVLDVGCGTGALTLAAVDAVGAEGRVTGLDANPEMLAVARRKDVPVQWVEGRAEELPFADGAFDAVVSQFAMMFFEDKARALRGMMRVLRPGGRLAVAVCGDLARSDGYHAFWKLLGRLFGAEVANAFAAPFSLGDAGLLAEICRTAGLADARIEERDGSVVFPSVRDMVSTERACVWTLGGLLDDDQFEALARASEEELSGFVEGGGLRFGMPALIVTAAKG